MRYIFILIALGINYSALSQTPRFFNLGQTAIPNENPCLVIKNSSKVIEKTRENINLYIQVTSLKLVGFDEGDEIIDSILVLVRPMKDLRNLIFENCDLSVLEVSLADFKKLEKISLLKETVFSENTFFPLLKNSTVKTIAVQTGDLEFITDSLYLLPQLTSIEISNEDVFEKANHTQTLQLKTKNGVQDIKLSYFGDYYKSNTPGVKTATTHTSVASDYAAYYSNYACIKQPVPGIKINDTVYTYDAAQKAHFTYQSGSKISIDRNAFLTQSGEKYTGPVSIFYREFRNPVEIMLSGIPMTNKENGETQLFKSGGMYEINAFDKNKTPLRIASDTSVKINFALTDTSKNFKFYSLNPNGSWATVANSITTVKTNTNPATKAVKEYYKFLNAAPSKVTDSTDYYERFDKSEYIYTYRKDNLTVIDTTTRQGMADYKKGLKKYAQFRVKYVRQTKDKNIVFTMTSVSKSDVPPLYISALFGKNYLYEGNLTKEQFRKLYTRKLLLYDVWIISASESSVTLDLKGYTEHYTLSGQIISLKDDKTYTVQKKAGRVIEQRFARLLRRDARGFKKDIQHMPFNKFNYYANTNRVLLAYQHSQKFQLPDEKKMNLELWKIYAQKFAMYFSTFNGVSENNELGNALVASGLGFKNIDCYIHSGEMQDIYVQYKAIPSDTINGEYNAFLYKTINTSYPLSNGFGTTALKGFYFKGQPNYIIRFSNNGMMQVSKPEKIAQRRQGNMISLDYEKQVNIKGMDCNAITKLILD